MQTVPREDEFVCVYLGDGGPGGFHKSIEIDVRHDVLCRITDDAREPVQVVGYGDRGLSTAAEDGSVGHSIHGRSDIHGVSGDAVV
jgi:hypothetical protein